MKATLTAYFNRNPKQLVVRKPAGEWMDFDMFLIALGFRCFRDNDKPLPGVFDFCAGNSFEFERVIGIVKSGGEYLTCGNFDYMIQV